MKVTAVTLRDTSPPSLVLDFSPDPGWPAGEKIEIDGQAVRRITLAAGQSLQLEPPAAAPSAVDALLASYPRSTRFSGEHACPRGAEHLSPGRAVWLPDESCSYCGSLHPDVFMERLERGDVVLHPTDKDYKVYVAACAGAAQFLQSYRGGADAIGRPVWTSRQIEQTKFYFQHLSADQRQRFVALLNFKSLRIGEPGYFYRLPFFICR